MFSCCAFNQIKPMWPHSSHPVWDSNSKPDLVWLKTYQKTMFDTCSCTLNVTLHWGDEECYTAARIIGFNSSSSLGAPSVSVASTKAVVMGLSLTCPLLCTPRLFPNQRWVPWLHSLFLAPSGAQRFRHSPVFMRATMSKRSRQPSTPCSVSFPHRWMLLFAL